MNDLPREKLRELIVEYGRSLCADPRRCEAFLKDYCGQYKREIFALVIAQKNRVADDLLKTSAGMPQSLILARLIKRMEDELGLAENVAQWAVESWALALEIIEQPLSIVAPSVPQLPLIPEQPQVAYIKSSNVSSDKLREPLQKISSIVALINDIIDQIDILALNAAIQASIMGKAGRGFTSVADEIQRLAEQSRNAIKQIEIKMKNFQLSDFFQEIGGFVELINDITKKINILAVKAAVEAARAGEQGRGFAVVAGEIRRLEKQSNDATKHIEILINAIKIE